MLMIFIFQIMTAAHGVFRTWDDSVKDFTNVAREVTRKRSEKFIPIKINPAHAKLVERVRYLRDWRKKHEQLAVTTAPRYILPESIFPL
jgi:hypothetical protein